MGHVRASVGESKGRENEREMTGTDGATVHILSKGNGLNLVFGCLRLLNWPPVLPYCLLSCRVQVEKAHNWTKDRQKAHKKVILRGGFYFRAIIRSTNAGRSRPIHSKKLLISCAVIRILTPILITASESLMTEPFPRF